MSIEEKSDHILQGVTPVVSRASSPDRKHGLREKEVQGTATFYETVTSSPLNPRSRTSFQLYGILLVAALNATASGFDGSIFSSINAMSQYRAYFHHSEIGSKSTGIIFMIYTIGNMIGSLFTGPICDRLGRRAGMATGAFIIMAAAAILTAAKNDSYLLGGRFLLGFGISIGTSSAPTYALELAPPQWRARAGGYYNSFFYTGSILSTGVAYAANKNQSQLAFRLPLGLQLIPPTFILLGLIFIPESPRWLMAHGHRDKAHAILTKYHGGGDPNHPVVVMEMKQFDEAIELQKTQSWWNYFELVNSTEKRWRFLMMALMSVFAQLSGNSCLTYYLPAMYTKLGIVSTDRRLLLTFANSIVSCAGAVAGSATNDRIGRRTKLWVGSIVLSLLFAAVTGFSSQFAGADAAPHPALSNAGIAFIFLFGCAYSFVYTPLTATYCSEVLSYAVRARGMGVHVIISNTTNLYNTYCTGIFLNSIGWRYYIVFVALNLFYAVVWYTLGVETRGRTLEELSDVFQARWPPRAALAKAKMVEKDGHLEAL